MRRRLQATSTWKQNGYTSRLRLGRQLGEPPDFDAFAVGDHEEVFAGPVGDCRGRNLALDLERLGAGRGVPDREPVGGIDDRQFAAARVEGEASDGDGPGLEQCRL